jgi:hypothetical protein
MRKYLHKLGSLAVVAVVGLASAPLSSAMPVAPLTSSQPSIMIQVEGRCGIGFHRGPYGGCRPNGAVVVVPGAVVAPAAPVVVAPAAPVVVMAPGPCGGRGMHRVCNILGVCTRVCN